MDQEAILEDLPIIHATTITLVWKKDTINSCKIEKCVLFIMNRGHIFYYPIRRINRLTHDKNLHNSKRQSNLWILNLVTFNIISSKYL